MNDAENRPEGDQQDDELIENDETSLTGKGWDILVGGRDNPIPEDTITSLSSISDNPTAQNLPAGAEFDQGRGAEDLEEDPWEIDEPMPGAPNNLSPEELEALVGSPEGAPIAEETIPEPMPEAPTNPVTQPEPLTPDEPESPPLDMDELTGEPAVTSDMPPESDSIANLFDQLSAAGGATAAGPAAIDVAAPPPSTPPPAETQDTVAPPPSADPQTLARSIVNEFTEGPDDLFGDARLDPALIRERAEVDSKKADPELTKQFVTDERLNALWDEISSLYDTVVNDVRGHYSTTQQSLIDLREARELLMADRKYYDNAEQLVKGVKARLRLEYKVREWSRTRGTFIGLYLAIWLVLLSLSSLFIPGITTGIVAGLGVGEILQGTIFPGLFGALGAVIGAIWVLVKHTSIKRDFDPIHTSWFLLNPLLGAALGVVTYFLVLVLSAASTTLIGAQVEEVSSNPVLVYALCVIVGFRQNVFWDLIERFLKTILPSNDDDSDAAEPTNYDETGAG